MSEGLWTAYEAAAATGGALCARGGDPDRWFAEEWAASGVSIDTRTIKPGELFVALKDARDGHEFLQSAFDKGASAALVARAPEDAPDGAPLLLVHDTLEGLRDLAAAARLRNFGKRIGVTGSVGKTTVKEMLRTALAVGGEVHAADKSFNNHWGVPLTLAALPMRADYGVFEIGMNHAGEITPLSQLVAPHVAIITTVAAAHLEFFDSVEMIAEAKAEIFAGVVRGGAAVLPIDNEHFPILRQRAEEAGISKLLTFGESADADVRLNTYEESPGGARITAALFDREISYALGAPGKHHAVNSLAVLAACAAAGADVDAAAGALKDHGAGAGRGARQEISIDDGSITLIDESYNANPTSMAAAIALLGAARPRGTGRRIALLGDMLELGPDAPKFHADLAPHLIDAGVDRLYVSGGFMRHLHDAAPAAMRAGAGETLDAVASAILGELQDGDVLLVKGSNASGVSALIGMLERASLEKKRKTG
ncbi:MAG: UDP-N-acetylmuramoyl-tripeptide--D-alanyl-D-alanine ligase [Pseudomonadota bacterium]